MISALRRVHHTSMLCSGRRRFVFKVGLSWQRNCGRCDELCYMQNLQHVRWNLQHVRSMTMSMLFMEVEEWTSDSLQKCLLQLSSPRAKWKLEPGGPAVYQGTSIIRSRDPLQDRCAKNMIRRRSDCRSGGTCIGYSIWCRYPSIAGLSHQDLSVLSLRCQHKDIMILKTFVLEFYTDIKLSTRPSPSSWFRNIFYCRECNPIRKGLFQYIDSGAITFQRASPIVLCPRRTIPPIPESTLPIKLRLISTRRLQVL